MLDSALRPQWSEPSNPRLPVTLKFSSDLATLQTDHSPSWMKPGSGTRLEITSPL